MTMMWAKNIFFSWMCLNSECMLSGGMSEKKKYFSFFGNNLGRVGDFYWAV